LENAGQVWIVDLQEGFPVTKIKNVGRHLHDAFLTHGGRKLQACRYLVIDFGTSKSSKSTRQRDNHYCPGRPASVPLRHTFVNSALATQHSLK
ncbi:hypothetical protein, partial [Thiolapillus sp.]|uniref:hypothetical protein n=1 Tax=Thiolapillus sp. TaxID=2017437 RepID=UPI003AF4DD8E